ncbi:MAG: ATP cone domain-containing protein [Candidatus Aenigmatarchaeota archaeon]
MVLQVIKRDNRLEDFDIEKIRRSIKNAGATEDIVERVAKDIEEDVSRVASCCIKDKVNRRLRIENPDIARVYGTYRKA